MLNVFFHYLDRKPLFTDKIKIRQFVQHIFKKEKVIIERIDYIFCSDDYLLEINKKFLKQDYYTDVIAFNLSDSSAKLKGEIYISSDRIKENAFDLKIKSKEEFLRVIIHGALHLCGYTDKSKKEADLMRVLENKYLLLFKATYK